MERLDDDFILVRTRSRVVPSELEFLGGVLLAPDKYVFRSSARERLIQVLFGGSERAGGDSLWEGVIQELLERQSRLEHLFFLEQNK